MAVISGFRLILASFAAVRDGMTALLSRAVFYRLAEIAVEHEVKEAPRLGVFSSGIFFPLD